MIELLLLLVVLLLVAANALFVAAEFSLVTVDRSGVERAARDGDAGAASVLAALRTLSTQLSGAQLGITISSLAVGFLVEPSIGELLTPVLGSTGLSATASAGLAVTVALVLMTAFQMVLGELVPKNWAIAEAMRVGRRVVGPQRAFTAATGPLIRFLNGSANRLLRVMNIEPQEELRSARRPEELAAVALRSGQQGTLDESTAALLERAVRFGKRTADDVMTPRPNVHFLRADQSAADVLRLCAETGHARFPVMGDSVDDVLGAVHFKHALAVPVEDRERVPVREVLRSIAGVPSTLRLDEVLAVLREPGLQIALVVDEYGGTDGIVTFEDLVEEIVGEITDEQDAGDDRGARLDDGSWLVSGLLRPDEAGRMTDLRLPESTDNDTLAGLLVERLSRVPQVGESVVVRGTDVSSLDEDGVPTPTGVRLQAEVLDGLRVDRVRVIRVPVEDVPAEEEL